MTNWKNHFGGLRRGEKKRGNRTVGWEGTAKRGKQAVKRKGDGGECGQDVLFFKRHTLVSFPTVMIIF